MSCHKTGHRSLYIRTSLLHMTKPCSTTEGKVFVSYVVNDFRRPRTHFQTGVDGEEQINHFISMYNITVHRIAVFHVVRD